MPKLDAGRTARGMIAGLLYVILVAGGFLVGLIVGRWWALAAPAAVGLWMGAGTEVEVPHWFLGAAYALMGAVGVGAGVLLRRRFARSSDHE